MATEFPVEYLNTLDKILCTESYTSAYQVQGAEFIGAKTVNVPELTLSDSLSDYTGKFANGSKAEIHYTPYSLEKDREYSFTVDAVEDMNENHLRVANGLAEVQRTLVIPELDTYFFAKAAAAAKTKATATLTAANIKAELRKVRTAFVSAGIANSADLFMSSTALALLEDATDRGWANEGELHTMIGRYDIFNIYEVPDAMLAQDFIAIAGGQQTIKTVIKRAVTRVFAPEVNQVSDGYLCQGRWVYGNVALKNKTAGIYASKAGATG